MSQLSVPHPILHSGPNQTRTKLVAEDALAILTEHGWITEISARPRVVRRPRHELQKANCGNYRNYRNYRRGAASIYSPRAHTTYSTVTGVEIVHRPANCTAMHKVFDHDGFVIGSLEASPHGIVARDVDGNKIGVFQTSIECVSAIHIAWRYDAEPARTVEDTAAKVADFWQTGKVRKPSRTLAQIEDDELIVEIEAALKGGKP